MKMSDYLAMIIVNITFILLGCFALFCIGMFLYFGYTTMGWWGVVSIIALYVVIWAFIRCAKIDDDKANGRIT